MARSRRTQERATLLGTRQGAHFQEMDGTRAGEERRVSEMLMGILHSAERG